MESEASGVECFRCCTAMKFKVKDHEVYSFEGDETANIGDAIIASLGNSVSASSCNLE